MYATMVLQLMLANSVATHEACAWHRAINMMT